MIWNWVMIVAEEEEGTEGFRKSVQWLAAFFYADDGLLASPQSTRLQAALYVLTGIFDRVGLHIKFSKTVGMVCQPRKMDGGHSETY